MATSLTFRFAKTKLSKKDAFLFTYLDSVNLTRTNFTISMNFRKDVFPRTVSDVSCFLLCFTFIPITLIFDLIIVLPEIHNPLGLFYKLAVAVGIFIVYNIVSNFLACMLIDTSIKNHILKPPSEPSLRKSWRYCSKCEVITPPRSWHCRTCRTCILKRDHHCMFTGCCIGHHNYRYFFFFMVYMAIGAFLSTIYCSFYFWWIHADTYANAYSFIKMILPMLMWTLSFSWSNFYLLIYELNVIAASYSIILILYHLPSLWIGAVSYEKKTTKYDMGWRENFEMILGKRMHLAWISPLIKSELPHDGIHWENIKVRVPKNR